MTKTIRRVLLSGAALGVLAMGGMKLSAEHAIAGALQRHGYAARVSADPLTGRITVTDLKGPALSIGKAVLPGGPSLMAPALAAQDVALQDVTIAMGAIAMQASSVSLAASSLTRDELQTLIAGTGSDRPDALLARISASSIRIPELLVIQQTPQGKATTTYRDVALTDVVAGRIARMSGASGAMTVAAPDASIAGTFGPWSGEEVDVPAIVRMFTAAAQPGEIELKTLYRSFEIAKIAMEMPKGAKVSYDRMIARDIKGRPGRRSFADAFRRLGEQANGTDLTQQEKEESIALLSDLSESLEVGLMQAEGIVVQAPDDKGAQVFDGRIARIGYEGAQTSRFSAEGLTFTAGPMRFNLQSMEMRDFSLKGIVTALREEMAREATGNGLPWAGSSPLAGTWELTGLDALVPWDDGAKPFAVSLAGFTTALSQPSADGPLSMRMVLRNLKADLPAKSKNESISTLVALGYRNLDLSFVMDGGWNRASHEFTVSDLSFSEPGTGQVSVKAILGNVGEDAFSSDEAVAQTAWLLATVKNLDIDLRNTGLAEKLLEREAKKRRKKPEDLRREYGSLATFALPAVLGNGPQARALSGALARFIAKPGALAVSARARNAEGVGAADLGADLNISSFLEKLDITAKAE